MSAPKYTLIEWTKEDAEAIIKNNRPYNPEAEEGKAFIEEVQTRLRTQTKNTLPKRGEKAYNNMANAQGY